MATRRCCQVRRQLADDFATASRLYAEAVVILAGSVDSGAEFESLRKLAREAQERAETAREAFETHVVSHHCETQTAQRVTAFSAARNS